MRYTISKASRVPDDLNYHADVFGAYFTDYWLAVAVCVLLTYCNPIGFTITTWVNGESDTQKVDVHQTQQLFWNVGSAKFQQATVLVAKIYEGV